MQEAAAVHVLRPYVIEVTFRDGTTRQIDMESELWGEVFEPLRDVELFAQVAVDPLFGTISWPTGADLAPEFVYYGDEGPPPDYYRTTGKLESTAGRLSHTPPDHH